MFNTSDNLFIKSENYSAKCPSDAYGWRIPRHAHDFDYMLKMLRDDFNQSPLSFRICWLKINIIHDEIYVVNFTHGLSSIFSTINLKQKKCTAVWNLLHVSLHGLNKKFITFKKCGMHPWNLLFKTISWKTPLYW